MQGLDLQLPFKLLQVQRRAPAAVACPAPARGVRMLQPPAERSMRCRPTPAAVAASRYSSMPSLVRLHFQTHYRAQVSVKVLKGFCERQLSPAEHPCKIIAFWCRWRRDYFAVTRISF